MRKHAKKERNVNHEFRNEVQKTSTYSSSVIWEEVRSTKKVRSGCNSARNKRSSYPSHPPQLLFLQSFQQVFVTNVYVLLP